MEYHSLSTLHPGRVAMFAVLLIMAALVIMAALPSCIAQTGQTNLKDTSTHNSCLSENGRLAVDRGTPCSQPEIAILVSGNNKMGLSLAPIVGPKTTPEEARKQFEDGARRGYAPAEVNLGVLYAYGWGVPQNLGTALYWIGETIDRIAVAIDARSVQCGIDEASVQVLTKEGVLIHAAYLDVVNTLSP